MSRGAILAAIGGGSGGTAVLRPGGALVFDVWLTGNWDEDFSHAHWRRDDVRPLIRANLSATDAPADNPYGSVYGSSAALDAGALDADAAARQLYDVLRWTIDGIAAGSGRDPEAIDWSLWLPHAVASTAFSWSSGALGGEPRNGRRAATNPGDRLADAGSLIWPHDSLARYSPYNAIGVPLAYAHALDVCTRLEALRAAGSPVYRPPAALVLDDEDIVQANSDYNTIYAVMSGDARAATEPIRADGATLAEMLTDAPPWTGAGVFSPTNAHMRYIQERWIEVADHALGASVGAAARAVWGALPTSNWELMAVRPEAPCPVFVAGRPLEQATLREMTHAAPHLYGLPGSTFSGNKSGWLADMGLAASGDDVADWQAVNGVWIARRIAACRAAQRPFAAWFRPDLIDATPFGSAPRRTQAQIFGDLRAFRAAGGSGAILWGGTTLTDWTMYIEATLA